MGGVQGRAARCVVLAHPVPFSLFSPIWLTSVSVSRSSSFLYYVLFVCVLCCVVCFRVASCGSETTERQQKALGDLWNGVTIPCNGDVDALLIPALAEDGFDVSTAGADLHHKLSTRNRVVGLIGKTGCGKTRALFDVAISGYCVRFEGLLCVHVNVPAHTIFLLVSPAVPDLRHWVAKSPNATGCDRGTEYRRKRGVSD